MYLCLVTSGYHAPVGMPVESWHDFHNWGTYSDTIMYDDVGTVNFTFPDDFTEDLRRAYFACISHMDDELGRVIDEMETLGMKEESIITFVGESTRWR